MDCRITSLLMLIAVAALSGTSHAEDTDATAEQSALIARHGCPHGSLCLELGKRADGPGLAAELIRVPVDWAERQFQAMGSPDARDLAVEVIARYQGIALLASTFRDPSLMEGEGRRVARWIDALGQREVVHPAEQTQRRVPAGIGDDLVHDRQLRTQPAHARVERRAVLLTGARLLAERLG